MMKIKPDSARASGPHRLSAPRPGQLFLLGHTTHLSFIMLFMICKYVLHIGVIV